MGWVNNWDHVMVGPLSGIPRQSLRAVTFLDSNPRATRMEVPRSPGRWDTQNDLSV
jgi:hypothetical protein